MAKQIIWTPEAEESLDSIIDYLTQNWSEKEVRKFLKKVFDITDNISQNPLSFRTSGKEDVREALVTRHNILIYRVTPQSIFLLYFWDTRKNPLKKPKD